MPHDAPNPDQLAALQAWGVRGGAPAADTPSVGEIWFVDNKLLEIEHSKTTEHPVIVQSVSGGVVRVYPGTGDPYVEPRSVAIHPQDVVRQRGERGLKKSTYFSAVTMPVQAHDLTGWLGRAGRASPGALADLDRLRRGALGGP